MMAQQRGGWEGAGAAHHQASTSAKGAAGAGAGDQAAQPDAAADPAPAPHVDEAANKLDSLMELTFEHLGQRRRGGRLRSVGG